MTSEEYSEPEQDALFQIGGPDEDGCVARAAKTDAMSGVGM